jgi:Glyoxalase-like domain
LSHGPQEFQERNGTEDWRPLASGASCWFEAPAHSVGADLLRGIIGLVGDDAPPPDIDLRPTGVRVRIRSGPCGLTAGDVSLARAISGVARRLGLRADPTALQSLQLTIDVVHESAVAGFWRDVFDYDDSEDGLTDPLRRDPRVGFQQVESLRPLRNRIHLDVNACRPFTRDRIAALEARGARETYRCDYYVTVADAEGNEACLPVGPPSTLGSEPDTKDWWDMGCALARYPTTSFAQSVDLVAAVARLADDAGKSLLVDVRPGCVTLDSGKDQHETEEFGNDEAFVELARRIQAAARGMGLAADPSPRLRFVQIAIDAVDVPAVRTFWMAALGYRHGPYRRLSQDIYDPRRLNPLIWFQQIAAEDATDEARLAQRNRIRFDLFIPDDRAQTRIDAAVAAGGRITNDSHAPARWTIADPEGNEIDIAVASAL